MEIFDREWANLYAWTIAGGSALYHVKRDRRYWADCYQALSEFWWCNIIPAKQVQAAGFPNEDLEPFRLFFLLIQSCDWTLTLRGKSQLDFTIILTVSEGNTSQKKFHDETDKTRCWFCLATCLMHLHQNLFFPESIFGHCLLCVRNPPGISLRKFLETDNIFYKSVDSLFACRPLKKHPMKNELEQRGNEMARASYRIHIPNRPAYSDIQQHFPWLCFNCPNMEHKMDSKLWGHWGHHSCIGLLQAYSSTSSDWENQRKELWDSTKLF